MIRNMVDTILTNQTIEFALPDNTIPKEWLRMGEQIWNDALTLLNWRQHYLRLQECLAVPDPDGIFDLSHPVAIEKIKVGNEYYLHCWIGRDVRIDKSKSWDKDNLEFIPSIRLVRPHWNDEPPIDRRTAFTVCKQFTKKAGYDYSPLPSGMMQNIISMLCDAWSKYIKTGAGKPKYKGIKHPMTSLGYDGFRNFCSIEGNKVKLVGLEPIEINLDRLNRKILKTYEHLLQEPSDRVIKAASITSLENAARFYAQPGAYRLIERADGEFIQFSGEFAVHQAIVKTAIVNISIGGGLLYKTDRNVAIEPFDRSAYDRRVINLQKVLATKKIHSKNWYKLQEKISKLQRKSAQATRRHQQYHAQWLADANGVVNAEKIPPVIVPVNVPIPDGDGNYLPNGNEEIAQSNLRASKLAIGQFNDLIKQQCDVKNREFNVIIRKERETPISVDNSPNLLEHGQAEGNDSQSGGKSDRLPTSNKRKTRNRRKELAIG
jgi:hypothetical protein